MIEALDASLAAVQDDLMEHTQRLVNAYEDLKRRVRQTLRIQHGDAGRLRAQQDEVRAFAADANRVRHFSVTSDLQYSLPLGYRLRTY